MRNDMKIAVLFMAVAFVGESRAFLPKPNSLRRGNSGIGGNRQGNDGGPPPRPSRGESWAGGDEPHVQPLMGSWNVENATSSSSDVEHDILRGGSSAQQTVDSVVKGSQATITTTASFWKKSFQSMTSKVLKPFKSKLSGLFKSKEKRQEEALMEQLKTMPVQRVAVPDSTVLPNDVVQLAARRSGILGSPLQTDRVQEFAKSLKVWYALKGYVLHSVTGATLKPESGTAEITVQEPRTNSAPVDIIFCKEMVVDDETGDLLSFRQYKDKHTSRKTFGYEKIEKENLNTTFVQTSGRTKPSRIASAMRLSPGAHFQWDSLRWQKISKSGIFSRILKASPQPMQDGTVQLHIYALEAPARHLEYGLGKSLYTDTWEGELDFQHVNLLGGGETLGVTVRRGTKDAEPTVRLRYSDEKFGMERGYDVELFSDFIGDQADEPQEGDRPPDYEHDGLMDRRGATFRLQNPIDPMVVRHSATSVSLERTATKTGLHETIGSASLNVGPFVKELPFDARSNIDARATLGTRIKDPLRLLDTDNMMEVDLKPYTCVTATTKQILPLGGSQRGSSGRPLILALRHSVTMSTHSLPRHEARALGSLNNIRGTPTNGRVSQILVGATELRIPIRVPAAIKTRQDAAVVVFGDWLVATKDAKSPVFRKSSIGVGLRKSVQGLPLHCNFSYSNEGKLKAACGLGLDFDV